MREVVIETDRLELCVPCMGDVGALASYWSDPETMKYIGKDGAPWTREMVELRIKQAIERQTISGMCFWVAKLRETNQVIGQGGIVPVANQGPEIELGYRLGREHWGNGYATEIARASALYGFETLGLEKLIAVTYPENTGSRKVLMNAGFTEIGLTDRYYETTCMLYELEPGAVEI
ncbi:MAG: GNAT family N-acetyltransferase [Phycisphaerales bacterium]